MSGKPTVISTFAGTGGSSLGYHWAGFRELLAIEWEDHAVECFRLNFPEVPVWQRDIKTVQASEILNFCGIKVGELDVFDGSPPCQGFSTAGSRKINDPRNYLFETFVQLVHDLQPKVFVMENVTGMAKGKMKGQFVQIIKTLKTLNYEVKCKQMNAKYYGVPQSRERLIFIGVRKDLSKVPCFPIPSKKLVTVKEAFRQIEEPQERVSPTGGLIRLVPLLKRGETANKYHPKGHFFGTHRLSWDRPSPTIIKTVGSGLNLFIHPEKNQSLSIVEAKSLCSFPANWALPGKYTEAWARLGNAVMPKFMQAIAETIKTEILQKCDKIEENPLDQGKNTDGKMEKGRSFTQSDGETEVASRVERA